MSAYHLVAIILVYCEYSNLVQVVNSVTVSHEELQKLKTPCEFDTCSGRDDSDDTLKKYNCNCDAFCSQVETCCIDSPYLHSAAATQRPVCRTVDEDMEGYFLIDQCPTDSENILKTLCEDEGNGEDNAKLLIPVTSLLTNMTYKNYFCFRCHEENNEFRIWSVGFNFKSKIEFRSNKSFLSYSRTNETWMITDEIGLSSIPVNLRFRVPQEISHLQKTCIPELVTECSINWTDEEIRNKCNAYMYVTQIKRYGFWFKYRNPHCALCNFEDLNEMICNVTATTYFPSTYTYSFPAAFDINRQDSVTYELDFNRLFSLPLLMDFIPRGGDKVGRIQRCDNNHVWDPFSKKCTSTTCGLPGYVLEGGKCKRP